MNIQSRKLVFIEELLRINDENLIIRLESFLKQEKKIKIERNLSPMTLNDYHEMIDQAFLIAKKVGLSRMRISKRRSNHGNKNYMV